MHEDDTDLPRDVHEAGPGRGSPWRPWSELSPAERLAHTVGLCILGAPVVLLTVWFVIASALQASLESGR